MSKLDSGQVRGCMDMLVILQSLIDKVSATDEKAFIVFIDYSKAFDIVSHSQPLHIMEEMGFPRHLVALLRSLYEDQIVCIR